MTDKWIYRINELGQGFNDYVGKKCANLGEMYSIGLNVPPGFALSIKACNDFMVMTGAAEEIRKYIESSRDELKSIEGLERISIRLREIVDSMEIPVEMEEEILTHYAELCEYCGTADTAVSARSAGTKSHPGQYETHLNVKGESEIIKKIKRVWSSAFNSRSISARERAGLPLHIDPIGVAVLKMVNARTAGVMFTADPNTGDSSRMIIEANWGLGESVVGGEAMPDVFILEKDTLRILENTLGTKGRYIAFQESGVAEIETPPDKKCSFCLTDGEVEQIGKLGKILEEHFGVPQDVEWAIDADIEESENVILLQTRPEIIAKKVSAIDQVTSLMIDRFKF